MEDYLKQALGLVKAQASIRVMTEEEMLAMAKKLADGIYKLCASEDENTPEIQEINPKAAIKERSITCLECNKSFRVITKKHMQKHDLSLDEYRTKYGYKRNLPLVCKSLQRERRKKMQEMRLWERKGE